MNKQCSSTCRSGYFILKWQTTVAFLFSTAYYPILALSSSKKVVAASCCHWTALSTALLTSLLAISPIPVCSEECSLYLLFTEKYCSTLILKSHKAAAIFHTLPINHVFSAKCMCTLIYWTIFSNLVVVHKIAKPRYTRKHDIQYYLRHGMLLIWTEALPHIEILCVFCYFRVKKHVNSMCNMINSTWKNISSRWSMVLFVTWVTCLRICMITYFSIFALLVLATLPYMLLGNTVQ